MESSSIHSNNLDQDGRKQVTNGTLVQAPLPQRQLRLNRRGFFMSSRQLKGQKSDKRQLSDSEKGNRIKSPPQLEKKKIKLSNSSNALKRHSTNTYETSQKDVKDTPPNKKHKPITWP